MMTKLDELIRDPDGEFRDPEDLVRRSELSNQERIVVLQSWQADLIELQKAADENMPSANREPGETAERLAKVTAEIAKLKEQEEETR